MSVFLPIQSYIDIAKISQYLAANDDLLASKKTVAGSLASASWAMNARYSRLLYLVRKAVEQAFTKNPADESLNDTGFYLYALCGRYMSQAQIIATTGTTIAPFIITNPSSQSVSDGANVTFTVLAGGDPTLTYQWKKDGVSIVGATNESLNLTGVTSADNGSYTVVVTNSSGTATSTAATLTVAASLTVYYYYGDTDYYAALSVGTDAITYNGNFTITTGSSISVPFPVGAEINKYEVVKVPIGESVKTVWFNTALNQGTVPDSAFRAPIIIGSFRYYISRTAISIDSTSPVIFS
jgi:hypothetical protein